MAKHIVILKKKYYDMLLSGEKTIESRFSYNKCAPFEKVKVGDELLIKQVGKNVTLTANVCRVEFYYLTPEKVDEIRIKYGKQIGTNKVEDWILTRNKKYASLIWVENLKSIEEFEVRRSCGAGWIVL